MSQTMGCERCADLDRRIDIRTPGELRRTIQTIRDSVVDDTLELQDGQEFDLPDYGPWPDVIDHIFECRSCGRRFWLRAETYHGAGGSWSSE